MTAAAPVLRMIDVAKAYGPTIAVRKVSLDVEPGEIHAILGENGAGKSTLVKMLSGIVAPDRGRIELGGEPYAPHDAMYARRLGVSTAFQELSLLPNLTVAQNLMLPRQVKGWAGFVSARRGVERAAAMLAEYGLSHIHPRVMVRNLSLADKQRLEIVRALARKPRVLVLDEPTAALAEPEWLFDILGQVTASGACVLYISHRLSEVRRLCRRGTVLRNGESIETVSLSGIDDDGIFRMMVGTSARSGPVARHGPPPTAKVALAAAGLTGGTAKSIDIEVREGEIVGVAALEGQGQRDLFRMLGGLRRAEGGEIRIDGAPVDIASPARAARSGIGYLPEERKTEGVFFNLKTSSNITLPVLDGLSRFGVVDRNRESAAVQKGAGRVDLASRYLPLRIGALSGGNQQKALLGRILLEGTKTLVLFDPTRGVDVGTKAVIYDVIRDFVDKGGAALVYSTELSELVHLVDRCVVIYGGRVAGQVSDADLTEERLVALAAGHGVAA
jgi:ribose transport system ATP-binding protein